MSEIMIKTYLRKKRRNIKERKKERKSLDKIRLKKKTKYRNGYK